MRCRLALRAVVSVAAAALLAAVATGGSPTAAGQAAAPASCAELTALELPDTTITAAERVPAGSFTPAAGAARC